MLDDEVDSIVEFVFSNCLSADAPDASETGGKKKTKTSWRSIVTAATKLLVRIVVGAHAASAADSDADADNERSQRSAAIIEKLSTVASDLANSVESSVPDQCSDNREHILLCACRCVIVSTKQCLAWLRY